ncbi:jouberin isoform X2 [Oryzias melastigma]|uniref:jouberin isoform X2 n=1 Tax=Oryzias melastigma TaxID=30732 RepID=UPI000CF7B6AD|nr:jouberin isoform X2 [Oryzias melastigma]
MIQVKVPTMPAGEREERAEIRERVSDAFRTSTGSGKKKSRKKAAETDTMALQNLMKNLPPGRGAKDDRTTLQNQGGEEARQQEQNWRSKRELPPLPVGGALDPEVGGKRRSQRSRRTAEDEDGLLEEYERGIAQEEGGRGSGRGQDHPPQKNSKKKLRGSQQGGGPNQQDSRGGSEEKPGGGRGEEDGLVLGVFVHRSDPLRTDLLISHPMVKIHVVDERTGQYVKKDDRRRPVVSFYEGENVDHVLPIMTQPFDFRRRKSVVPEWEEQILFNERFAYFLQQDDRSPRVLLLFEILDFMTMEEARASVDADGHERGFRKIAWAFLKLVGANGVRNVDSKLRLQLFCPPPRAKRQPKSIEVFEWWRKFPRTKYASTLYVTVRGIQLPAHVDPSVRSMMALQEERGSSSYSELQKQVSRRTPPQTADSRQPELRWSRLPGQTCRIPNKHVLSFRGGHMGCFSVLFSNAGTILAAACADRDAFPVVVFEIPSGKVLAAFSGHLKIVYDLCWSRDDGRLLSASSDGTVREWNVEKLLGTAQKVLPHPAFVYCSRYHPRAQNLAVTGSFDCLVRVWRLDVSDVNGELLQEFDGHSSFINSICFDSAGSRMFSADNGGLIMVWKTAMSEDRQQQSCSHWCTEKKLEEAELRGVPINTLQLHPNGRCLFVHARDSVLRMMDLRILAVKKFSGATNYRERICGAVTPCGTWIFSGSEDGMAYVWNVETGDQVEVYSELGYSSAVHAVAFHPHENMVAFCAFGQGQPVHVYLYDHKGPQPELQSLKVASRSASEMGTLRNTPDPPVGVEAARRALKLQSVRQRLDSVLGQVSSATPHGQGGATEGHTPYLFAEGRDLVSDSSAVGFSATQPPPPPAEGRTPPAGRGWGVSPDGLLPPGPCEPIPTLSGGFQGAAASVQQVVVSLFDYRASRSDELSLRRGDVIQVLFKDNQTWWFGRLHGGLQGYFLSAYVVDQRDFRDRNTEALPAEETTARSTPTRVSAAVSSSGELRFLSEPTLSDTEPELTDTRTRRKKKVKKPGVPVASSQIPDPEPSGLTRTTRGRPLPKRPTGRSNSGFEGDM